MRRGSVPVPAATQPKGNPALRICRRFDWKRHSGEFKSAWQAGILCVRSSGKTVGCTAKSGACAADAGAAAAEGAGRLAASVAAETSEARKDLSVARLL